MVTMDKPKAIKGKKYTIQEAIELMRERDKYPTTGTTIKWVDSKTKLPVNFTY